MSNVDERVIDLDWLRFPNDELVDGILERMIDRQWGGLTRENVKEWLEEIDDALETYRRNKGDLADRE